MQSIRHLDYKEIISNIYDFFTIYFVEKGHVSFVIKYFLILLMYAPNLDIPGVCAFYYI